MATPMLLMLLGERESGFRDRYLSEGSGRHRPVRYPHRYPRTWEWAIGKRFEALCWFSETSTICLMMFSLAPSLRKRHIGSKLRGTTSPSLGSGSSLSLESTAVIRAIARDVKEPSRPILDKSGSGPGTNCVSGPFLHLLRRCRWT